MDVLLASFTSSCGTGIGICITEPMAHTSQTVLIRPSVVSFKSFGQDFLCASLAGLRGKIPDLKKTRGRWVNKTT